MASIAVSVICPSRTAAKHWVSIIVVNWNGENLLENCLSSLVAQRYLNRDVILVDNGSTDDSVRFVRERFPAVRVVKLSRNEGFTGGNIEGLKTADGEFIALINNDTRAEETWLQSLIQPMLEDPAVGICASKILFDNRQRV